jgi:hypothetical protein
MPPYVLTAEVERLIIGFIRSGGYPWVAAESAGIPRAVYARWLRRGARSGSRSRYRFFYKHVLEARAQARLSAEIETRKDDPRYWLTHGPGREKANAPGWTNPASGQLPAKKEQVGRNFTKQFLRTLDPVLEALAPFPEARQAVAREFERLDETQKHGVSPPRRRPKKKKEKEEPTGN